MPLLERIQQVQHIEDRRRPLPAPQAIAERMSPFLRRLRDKNLPAKELYNGAYVPSGDRGAA